MKQFVEVPLEEGGSILVEVDGIEEAVALAGRRPGEIVIANESFESTVDMVRPVASAIVRKLREIPDSPDEINVAFGLGLKFDSSGILKMLVSTGSEVNFNVSFTWKK